MSTKGKWHAGGVTRTGQPATTGIWPIKLQSSYLLEPGWTLWGTAAAGHGDWFLARLGRILLLDSADALSDFVASGSSNHCFASVPAWVTLALERSADDADEFDFDEDGMWLFSAPAQWDGARRAEVLDRLNLLWDAANQFDDKLGVRALRGGGRGSLLGHLADALMESDETTLAAMAPEDVRADYTKRVRAFISRCEWVAR